MGSTVRIISPGMLSTVERQNQPQAQQLLQQTQQVTNMPATYHVPRGPAAVANISAPRSTVATPIVRANTGQAIPTTRSGYIYAYICKGCSESLYRFLAGGIRTGLNISE